MRIGGREMTIPDVLAAAIERRERAGLKLTFIVPDRPDPFVCYPKDAADKAKWLRQAVERGWKLVGGLKMAP